jgi:uncharacterized protein involved in exopolysaccharide biosynthesis
MDRTYTVDELFAAVRRRWKVMAMIAGGVLALAAVVIARLPDEYKARALVMVEPFTPHPDLVVPVFGSNSLEEKVKSVRAQVYARGVMSTAIEELKLYPREREKYGMDGAIEAMRTDTEVHADGDNVFAIIVRGKDADVAARTANRLAELVIEGNLQVRAGQVTRTREIISQKLADLRGELAKADAKVAAFKHEHADTLPELLEARIHEREQIVRQIAQEDGFSKEAQHRIDLLGTQPFGKDTEVGRLEEQYDEMRARLGAMAASLTPDHPDLQQLKRAVDASYGRMQNARARAAQNDLEQRRMKGAIERSGKRIGDLEQRIAQIDKLIAGIPVTRAQIGEMEKDVDMLKVKVTSLISKKAEAEIAAELETKSAPAEFRVLESAQPATLASSPNRPQALLLALLAAIALGCAVALGQELSDRSLRSEGEVSGALTLPVLACVPALVVGSHGPRLLSIHTETEG